MRSINIRYKTIARSAVIVLGIVTGVATSEIGHPASMSSHAVVFAQDDDLSYCKNIPMGCSSYGCTDGKCDLVSDVQGVKCGAPACTKINELQ